METQISREFTCPRDKLSFRAVFPDTISIQTDICIDTDDPNAYLIMMRQRAWTRVITFGMPQDIAFWGQHLRELEIRTDETISLNVVEFLPNLKRLRVMCGCIEHGFGWNHATLTNANIITPSTCILHSEISGMTQLETLCIESNDTRAFATITFPASLRHVSITGTVRDPILDAISRSQVETLVLKRGLLCDFPTIPNTVKDLDLSENYIISWDTYHHTPASLERVSLAGNVAFSMASLPRTLGVRLLDIRGTGESYPMLEHVTEIWHTYDPPSDIATRCPRLRTIHIKPVPHTPIPGADILAMIDHGTFHPEHGHITPDMTTATEDGRDDDSDDDQTIEGRDPRLYREWTPPTTHVTSYIDDINIIYTVPL